jgi:quinoprotein dehydrogenase-associated probable ABC transporter substrate-binding protein
MSSACKLLLLSFCLTAVIVLAPLAVYAATPQMRVCADPNNLPYSNYHMQGFENRIADLIAKDLGMEVSYFWYPQREKFFRQTLNSGMCDVVMGVPSGFEKALTTRPYYRSSYVFISRRDRNLRIDSFDDPRLKTLSIGVHVLGDSDKSQPPVFALTTRGIVRNLVGFNIFGNLYETDPSADLIHAVSEKKVDVAVVWGPLAGYFAQRSDVPLDITHIAGDALNPSLPLSFDIGIGVRKGDTQLQQQLDSELTRRKPDIDRILRSFGVPDLKPDEATPTKSASISIQHAASSTGEEK